MTKLQRTVWVLTSPVIALFGASCGDMPTEPRPADVRPGAEVGLLSTTTRWVNDDDPNGGVYDPPGTSCSDPGYPTIQDAVNAAAGGDIIQVCAGTYNEGVTINQPLTVLGPNATVPWNGGRGPEAFVTSLATAFNVTNGLDVTIAGFTITGAFGVFVSGSTTNTAIENNIITGTVRALSLEPSGSNTSVLDNHLSSPTRSMHLSGSGPYSNLKVNGNRFSGPGNPGIQFIANIPISGFEFRNNEVFVYANIASDIVNGTVSGNTFDAPPGRVLNLQILLQNSTMTDNVFEGDDMSACLQLFGTQFSPGDPSHHVTISDNTFSDCGGLTAPFIYAIQLSQDVHHIDITNNEIADGNEGVNTRDLPPPWNVTGLEIHINFNNITNNTSFGVRNGQSGVLDAECNWWGAADGPGLVGPGSGDNVSTNVDYEPWLNGPAPGGVCIGGVPSGKVTGGGQINVTDGRGTFGFNAKSDEGVGSGHLNYQNHATGAHLDCEVKFVTELTTTTAKFQGTCTPKGTATATSFMAEVEDHGHPGKNVDKFKIMYGGNTDGSNVTTIRSGNIQIHK